MFYFILGYECFFEVSIVVGHLDRGDGYDQYGVGSLVLNWTLEVHHGVKFGVLSAIRKMKYRLIVVGTSIF